MQLYINNWAAQLTAQALPSAGQLIVEPAQAAQLLGLGGDNYYLLTLVELNGQGVEIDWEVVTVIAADETTGELTLAEDGRGQEGTDARLWAIGTAITARVTAATLAELRDNPVKPGDLAAVATSGSYTDLSDKPSIPDSPGDIGAATAAQGAKADSAVQPGALAAVATSGSYSDLSAKPSIPDSPGDIGAATAAQGALAASAVQPGDLAAVATSGSYADLSDQPTAADVGAVPAAEKGAAGGVATLGGDAKIPLVQLPATAITSTFVVNTEAAMLALDAQEGDVAVRPDITTSFILAAEPASTLANWQELLSPAAGGGAPVGSSTPQPLGTATPGVSTSSSRQDHVHEMPSAAEVGADAAGAAAAAQAHAVQRSNHTGTQAMSTVDGLSVALAAKEQALIAGDNISIDRSDPDNPVISSSGGGGGREVLTTDRTYYVRTDGSDSNDGLSNTAGGAFLTIQKAVDAAAALDQSTYAILIAVGDGNRTGAVVLKDPVGSGTLTLRGNISTPASCLISTTSATAVTFSQRPWLVEGFELRTTTSGNCIAAPAGARGTIGVNTFGACAGRHIAAFEGKITISANYTISGGAYAHWLIQGAGASITCQNRTITLSGTPAFTLFAEATTLGGMIIFNNTFSGTATGKRYDVLLNAVVNTFGAGATHLPGNVNGTAPTGLYA